MGKLLKGSTRGARIAAGGVALDSIASVEASTSTYRLLSVDGGGSKGIIAAVLLDAICAKAKKAPHELFHVGAGTSTGSILTTGVALPGTGGKPKYTTREAIDLYETLAPKLFEKDHMMTFRLENAKAAIKALGNQLKGALVELGVLQGLGLGVIASAVALENIIKAINSTQDLLDTHFRQLGLGVDLLGALTSGEVHLEGGDGFHSKAALQDLLEETFGKRRMSESFLMELALTTFSLKTNDPKVWATYHEYGVLSNGRPSMNGDPYVHDIVTASCAAPIFFAPHELGNFGLCIDGGWAAQNPALSAILDGKLLTREEPLIVLSLGCGTHEKRAQSGEHWGLNRWFFGEPAMLALGLLLEAQYDMHDRTVEGVLRPQDRYIRLNVPLDDIGEEIQLDEGRPEMLKALRKAAEAWVKKNDALISEAADLLTSTKKVAYAKNTAGIASIDASVFRPKVS